MTQDTPNPSALMDLATAYWNSAALLAANELRLFDHLSEGFRTAQMLLSSEAGAVFSAADGEKWLGLSGFEQIRTQPLPSPLPYVVLSGNKPVAG